METRSANGSGARENGANEAINERTIPQRHPLDHSEIIVGASTEFYAPIGCTGNIRRALLITQLLTYSPSILPATARPVTPPWTRDKLQSQPGSVSTRLRFDSVTRLRNRSCPRARAFSTSSFPRRSSIIDRLYARAPVIFEITFFIFFLLPRNTMEVSVPCTPIAPYAFQVVPRHILCSARSTRSGGGQSTYRYPSAYLFRRRSMRGIWFAIEIRDPTARSTYRRRDSTPSRGGCANTPHDCSTCDDGRDRDHDNLGRLYRSEAIESSIDPGSTEIRFKKIKAIVQKEIESNDGA